MTNIRKPTADDWAEEAESAERAEAWPQAAALWRRAVELATNDDDRQIYARGADRCDAEVAIHEQLADMARRVLQIPTLESRKSDQLDFPEVAVWSLKRALRLAYRMGCETQQR